MLLNTLLFLLILLIAVLHPTFSNQLTSSTHADNWAVIVSTSKYFFNYRHNADALALYRTIKELGIPDSNIILMLPEDIACSPKNVVPGTVYNSASAFSSRQKGLYNDNNYDKDLDPNNLYDETSIEIDYKGDDVTVENFLRVLTNRHHPNTGRKKRLATNANSNLFIYLSGHGGDSFLKFRDTEVLTAQDLAFAMQQLHAQHRFREAFLIVETCQAATMIETITTPNVITSTSSIRGENSYSHGVDSALGLSVVDKYTFYLHEFYAKTNKFAGVSMHRLLNAFGYKELRSTHHIRTELYELDENGKKIRDLRTVPALDFFGATLASVPTAFTASVTYDWRILDRYNVLTNGGSLNIIASNGKVQALTASSIHLSNSTSQQTVRIDEILLNCIDKPLSISNSQYSAIKDQIMQQHDDLLNRYNSISPILAMLYSILPLFYILSVLLVACQVYYSLLSDQDDTTTLSLHHKLD